MYLDANNSYGWAITQPVPTFNFKWLTDEEMEELDLMMVPDDSSMRYILEYVLFLLSLYLCIFHKVYCFFPMYFGVSS